VKLHFPNTCASGHACTFIREPEVSETSEKTKLKEGKELMEDMGVTHLTPVEVDMK
jgi:hypothetical protein